VRPRTGQAACLWRLGAAQLAGDDEVTRAQLGSERSRHPDKGDGCLFVEPGGELGAGAPGTLGARADDDVGAPDGEGFDPKRGKDL
jgi:hypothetical protein